MSDELADFKKPPQDASLPDAELPKKQVSLDELGENYISLPIPYSPEHQIWQNVPTGLLAALDPKEPIFSLMPPAQRLFLWTFIYGVCPKRYLEIGTAHGASARLVATAIQALGFEDFQGVCIDPQFQVDPTTRQMLEATNFTFYEAFSSIQVMKQAREKVGDLFDVILVDGDHTYDHALADIILVMPFLKPGGYLLADDAGYGQVRDAIQYVVEHCNMIDAGFMCRHLTPVDKILEMETPQTGPWQGQRPFMSGLYVLRKPV